MNARVRSAALAGIEAIPVDVETQVISTLKRFAVVGLPDGVLREAKDRVRCAIENSGFEFPTGEVIVSLAPASLPKHGAGFDLALALSVLVAGRVVKASLARSYVTLGELALDGRIKPVAGALSVACMASDLGSVLITGPENAEEAAYLEDARVLVVRSLLEAVMVINGVQQPQFQQRRQLRTADALPGGPDFSDVVGQRPAKRALEVAAAGAHNLLMIGPPGGGKSMLSRRLISILPPLEHREALEVQKIYSLVTAGAAWERRSETLHQRPFRAPHHTTSIAGLIGGGSNPIPGEISLAHKGVLFLDEFAELRRDTMESLRDPLEAKQVVISRARQRVRYPADFMLVAAMNPCPCGRRGRGAGTDTKERQAASACNCLEAEVKRYRARISGPIADRIDIHIWVPSVPVEELATAEVEDLTPLMRARISAARRLQEERLGLRGAVNAAMTGNELKVHCRLSAKARKTLEDAARTHELSARGYTRVLKVARTVADLEGSASIEVKHLAEALTYRESQLRG